MPPFRSSCCALLSHKKEYSLQAGEGASPVFLIGRLIAEWCWGIVRSQPYLPNIRVAASAQIELEKV
ncbi:hypothetical protein [Ktedonobacter sp. SOSP1-52]|uniref:hypothetical protein n=1 Tax=Ktedonobacter sp. SOSP1-52 TaxID=2778366 RepID=UPI0019153062|nr:hypothetical protein [Ktedonobacter sp. SOSP1-52]